MVEETKIVEGSPTGEVKKKIKKSKWISPIAFIIIILLLVIIKIIYKDISMVYIIGIGVFVGLICLITFFSSNIIEYFKNRGREELEGKIPKAITPEEADKEHQRVCFGKNCGVKMGKLFNEGHGSYGENNKEMIFWRVYKGYNNDLIYFWGINMHYLNKHYTILGEWKGEKSWPEVYSDNKHKLAIDQALKRLPTDTEKPANTKVTRTSNPAMGYESETIEKTHQEIKKDKKEKEDLE